MACPTGTFTGKREQKGVRLRRAVPPARVGRWQSYAARKSGGSGPGGPDPAEGQAAALPEGCRAPSTRERAASTAASSLALLAPPWVFTITRITAMKRAAMTKGGSRAET